MKKILYLILAVTFASSQGLTGQAVNILVSPDSVHAVAPATETEIDLPSQITNNSGNLVTIRWTRVIEQKPQAWSQAFCDKNLCYLAAVSSKTFELVNGESGLLKPIFYPNETPGTGVMRMYYTSETPGVVWADTAVYIAVATEAVGTVESQLVRDIAVFPNPATDVLNIVTASAGLKGEWRIVDVIGKVWKCSSGSEIPFGCQIDISSLPTGVYYLNVLTLDGKIGVAKHFVVLH